MSEALSSALRFEDHFGPIVPEVPASSAPRPTTPQPSHSAARLRDLAHAMRRNVVQATLATDVTQKVELWASYRTARAEALALAASVSPQTVSLQTVSPQTVSPQTVSPQSPPRLHSV
jgi:hypothetical protein